jgi:hypothetical protein
LHGRLCGSSASQPVCCADATPLPAIACLACRLQQRQVHIECCCRRQPHTKCVAALQPFERCFAHGRVLLTGSCLSSQHHYLWTSSLQMHMLQLQCMNIATHSSCACSQDAVCASGPGRSVCHISNNAKVCRHCLDLQLAGAGCQ